MNILKHKNLSYLGDKQLSTLSVCVYILKKKNPVVIILGFIIVLALLKRG